MKKPKKVFINLLLDPAFLRFLTYMKEENGMVKGRTISLGVTRQYKEKYNAFLENYEQRTDKQ